MQSCQSHRTGLFLPAQQREPREGRQLECVGSDNCGRVYPSCALLKHFSPLCHTGPSPNSKSSQKMSARSAAAPPSEWESAGKLPPFTAFGTDVESPGGLERVAAQIAYKREIFLVCGDGSAYASPTALNTVLQLYALRIRHVLYISDSRDACNRLREAVPTLACAWSSVINTSKPTHDSVLVKKWWDMRFYFYNVRKHMLS